jgi:hypothetical protein
LRLAQLHDEQGCAYCGGERQKKDDDPNRRHQAPLLLLEHFWQPQDAETNLTVSQIRTRRLKLC